MTHRTVYREVEIDLADFDTDELIEELLSRGIDMNTVGVDGDEMRELLTKIWQNRRCGMNYDGELDQLIYEGLGKVL
jgi:hypothetical protein